MNEQNIEKVATKYGADNTLERIVIHNTKTHKVEYYNTMPVSFEEAAEIIK